MIRLGNKWLRTVLCTGLVAAVTGACTDTDTSMFIQGNIQLQAPTCIARADASAVLLGEGLLDVAFSLEYTAALLVGSQLAPRGDKAQLRPETMRVALKGAEVSLSDLQGREIEGDFSVVGNGFVNPSPSDAPGYGVVFVDLIPATVGDRLQRDLRGEGVGASRTVIADVSVFGDTLGGDEVQTASYLFPIKVCYGCSVVFPLEAITAGVDGFQCGSAAESVAFEVCQLGQDSLIDCRACVATHPEVCQNPG